MKAIICILTALLFPATELLASDNSTPDSLSTATIDTGLLENFSGFNTTGAFQGLSAGLIVRPTNGSFANQGGNIFVRGQHSASSTAIVIIDGMERDLNDISIEEIGSVELLKSASAKALFGPRAANGAIVITTKRSRSNGHTIHLTGEYGALFATKLPKFLNSYEYATLYNEARANDGYAPYYSQEALSAYKVSSGESDLTAPDVDWYGRFTKNAGNYRKVSFETTGGANRIKYAVVSTYMGGSGFETEGDVSGYNRINIRGNLDIVITDFLVARADISGRYESRSWGAMSGSSLYSALSSFRPNEYPLEIRSSDIGKEDPDTDIPYYLASFLHPNNILGTLRYGGNNSERYVTSQTNFGLDFNLDRFVKGLKADAYLTFDNYNFDRRTLSKQVETYTIDNYCGADGQPESRIVQLTKIDQNDNINISSHSTLKKMSWAANLSYAGTVGRHDMSARMFHNSYQSEQTGTTQNCITTNTGLSLKWSYGGRLSAEFVGALMGSNQFDRNNRFFFAPAFNIEWVISPKAPFLMLKADAGRVGFMPDANYLQYRTAWEAAGKYLTGSTNNSYEWTTNLRRLGNPDLNWIYSTEGDISLYGSFFSDRLALSASAFVEKRDNLFSLDNTSYGAQIGSYLKSVNKESVLNRGLELSVDWKDACKGNSFRYEIGVNLTLTRNKWLTVNEVEGIEDYRTQKGRPTSSLFGLESQGLFGKDVQLDGHPLQTFGKYGVGDVAYTDKNNDSFVDSRDETYIGQAFPIAVCGAHAELSYKGLSLFVLLAAETGASLYLNNNYFWNNGSNSYSVLANDRYHPVNNPGGRYPALTTTSGTNSYKNSQFWLADASFLRVKNIRLSYTLDFGGRQAINSCKFFLNAMNPFVISGIPDLDPEFMDGGISQYPSFTTLTGGISLTF